MSWTVISHSIKHNTYCWFLYILHFTFLNLDHWLLQRKSQPLKVFFLSWSNLISVQYCTRVTLYEVYHHFERNLVNIKQLITTRILERLITELFMKIEYSFRTLSTGMVSEKYSHYSICCNVIQLEDSPSLLCSALTCRISSKSELFWDFSPPEGILGLNLDLG